MRVHKNLFGSNGQDKIHGDEIYFDSGKNSNGYYIKFPDGTMICYHSEHLGVVDLEAAYDGYESVQGYQWDFPVNFLEGTYPMVSIDVSGRHIWATGAGADEDLTLATRAPFRILGIRARSVNVRADYFAFGRWK